MVSKLLRLIGYVAALVTGVPASPVVGAAVFADGAGLLSAERLVPVVIVYLVWGTIASFACGLIWLSLAWWRWGLWFSVTGLAAIALLGTDMGVDFQMLYVAVTIASACLGAYAGLWSSARLRNKRRRG